MTVPKDPNLITVTLTVDRQLWNMARALNTTLGPGVDRPNSRNMATWVDMIIARYVAEQISTPERREVILKKLKTQAERAVMLSRNYLDDAKVTLESKT